MAGGYVHTALAFEMTDSERYLRCRTQALKQIYLDTVGGEDVGYGLGKEASVVATVMSYHDSHLTVLHVLKAVLFLYFVQIVGIALRSLCHDVLVHSVGTYAHDTAQTAGTEFEGTIESIDQFGLVLSVDHRFHLCAGLRVKRLLGPYLSNLQNLFQFFVHSIKFIYDFTIYDFTWLSPNNTLSFLSGRAGICH